jgi:hypothetical protein
MSDLKAFYEKATARPWSLFPKDGDDIWPGIEGPDQSGVSVVLWGSRDERDDAGVRGEDDDMPSADANAALIVHAVNSIEASEAERDRLREALEKIERLGDDGEHSGDRHARCRDIARSALNPHEGEKG